MSRLGNDRGAVLLFVLMLVVVLTAVLMELAFSTLVDLRLAETFRDRTRAYYLARGGLNAGRMLLQADRNNYDAPTELWAQGVPSYPVAGGTVSVQIEDLGGKLNLNELVRGNNPQAVMVDRFYRFLVALDIEELADPAALTAAVIDWLDSGDEPYAMILTDDLNIPVAGAEDPYYRSLQEGYPCKNGPLESLEELQQVRGFSRQVFAKVAPYLTINGDRKINLNTAESPVLQGLNQLLDADVAEQIISRRQEAPLRTVDELESTLTTDIYSALKSQANQKILGTTSSFYRVSAIGLVNDGQSRLTADIDKQNNRLLFLKVD